MRILAGNIALIVAVLSVSCTETGENRHRISGEAIFDGKPIPYGEVLFTPDGAKDNSGPQGIATIKDGKYDTSSADGKGIAGGPTVVRVTGLTEPGGKLLCEYEYTVDLPRSDTTLKIEVPPEGAPKKQGESPDI